MIQANKGGPLGWLVARYIDRKIRGAFRGVWVRGVLPDAGDSGLLVYANHTNFWDGFVAHAVSQAAGWDGHCAMEEVNLARYRFLTRLGAFSIRPGDGTASLGSLRYAARLVRRPKTAVFIFPEGVLHPLAEQPRELRRGIEVLAGLARVPCLPMAFRYAFVEHELPDVLVEVGAPHAPDRIERFAKELRGVTERVQAARSLEGFCPVVRGRKGVAERWDAVRGEAPSRPQIGL